MKYLIITLALVAFMAGGALGSDSTEAKTKPAEKEKVVEEAKKPAAEKEKAVEGAKKPAAKKADAAKENPY